MEKSKIDLLPCPFCGEKDLYLELSSDFGADVVICRGCLATFSQQEITCEEDLIKAWNTRASGWIPCSERMPEQDGEYLVLTEYEDVFNCTFDSNEENKWGFEQDYHDPDTLGWAGTTWTAVETVTHWMPLPDPPEAEDKT